MICGSLINQFYNKNNPENFLDISIELISRKTCVTAKLVANIQTTLQKIKGNLYRNFADQRDESCLT